MDVKVEFNITGIPGIIRTLSSLPAEVVSKKGGPVKLALAKGARFLRDKERQNLQAVLEPGDESTGLLAQNIIATRGKAPSDGNGERYLVRIKRRMYPGRKGEQVSTLKSAQLKEYGSVHQPARSFIRRTVNERGEETINLVVGDLSVRIDRLVAKLAQQNRGGR
ncbi:HK97-gp10 family putative phage morphogenesis protein [Stenotrophomonas geniculata]